MKNHPTRSDPRCSWHHGTITQKLPILSISDLSRFLIAISDLSRFHGPVPLFFPLYPALPLLVLFLHWNLATRKIVRRSTPFFDGLIGLSDFCGFLGVIAYFACIIIVVRSRSAPAIRRAARCVVYFVPITWTALVSSAIWDPFRDFGVFLSLLISMRQERIRRSRLRL